MLPVATRMASLPAAEAHTSVCLSIPVDARMVHRLKMFLDHPAAPPGRSGGVYRRARCSERAVYRMLRSRVTWAAAAFEQCGGAWKRVDCRTLHRREPGQTGAPQVVRLVWPWEVVRVADTVATDAKGDSFLPTLVAGRLALVDAQNFDEGLRVFDVTRVRRAWKHDALVSFVHAGGLPGGWYGAPVAPIVESKRWRERFDRIVSKMTDIERDRRASAALVLPGTSLHKSLDESSPSPRFRCLARMVSRRTAGSKRLFILSSEDAENGLSLGLGAFVGTSADVLKTHEPTVAHARLGGVRVPCEDDRLPDDTDEHVKNYIRERMSASAHSMTTFDVCNELSFGEAALDGGCDMPLRIEEYGLLRSAREFDCLAYRAAFARAVAESQRATVCYVEIDAALAFSYDGAGGCGVRLTQEPRHVLSWSPKTGWCLG